MPATINKKRTPRTDATTWITRRKKKVQTTLDEFIFKENPQKQSNKQRLHSAMESKLHRPAMLFKSPELHPTTDKKQNAPSTSKLQRETNTSFANAAECEVSCSPSLLFSPELHLNQPSTSRSQKASIPTTPPSTVDLESSSRILRSASFFNSPELQPATSQLKNAKISSPVVFDLDSGSLSCSASLLESSASLPSIFLSQPPTTPPKLKKIHSPPSPNILCSTALFKSPELLRTSPPSGSSRSPVFKKRSLKIMPTVSKESIDISLNDSIFNDSFHRVQKNPSPTMYKYKADCVRKKDERDKLCGYACKCCEAYFDALQLTPNEREQRMQHVSRHRDRQPPPNTPEHFWDVGFPNTPELEARQAKVYGESKCRRGKI